MSKMPKKVVAITGNIASGKTACTDYLIAKGYQIIDTDELTSKMYEDNIQFRQELISLLGEDIIVNDKIAKKSVGDIVFNDNSLLVKINNIAHPIIKKETQRLINDLDGLIFIDVPLLFEAKFDDLADEIILITVEQSIQIARLMKRNMLDESAALIRIKAQQSQESKINKATYVIDNSEDLKSFYDKIDNVLIKIEKR